VTSPVYLALDQPQLDTGLPLVDRVREHVGGVKMGLELFCAQGQHR
jgi:orotidine-5'-phosphate decarboxylase